MKEINLVPGLRTPLQRLRLDIIKTKDVFDIITQVIETAYNDGMALKDMVILIVDEVAKAKAGLDLPDAATLPIPDGINLYLALGPRAGFSNYMMEVFPSNTGYGHLDEPPPERFVYVVVAAFGGVTTTALGEFVIVNAPASSLSN